MLTDCRSYQLQSNQVEKELPIVTDSREWSVTQFLRRYIFWRRGVKVYMAGLVVANHFRWDQREIIAERKVAKDGNQCDYEMVQN